MELFNIEESKIPGCRRIFPVIRSDNRGTFTKTYHSEDLQNSGIDLDYKEEYYSVSKKNVIRGMHYQNSPMDHEKLVYCVCGKVLDVVLDIRKGTPSYGQYEVYELSPEKNMMLLIPRGCAHGFLALEDDSVMMYKVTSIYSASHDNGVLWNSFGFSWPVDVPLLSDRDKQFKSFKEMA